MGIRFFCPKGHKLNVKEFQAGRKGICPYCGARIQIPTESTRPPSKRKKRRVKPHQSVAARTPSAPAREDLLVDLAAGRIAPLAAGSPAVESAPAAAATVGACTVGLPRGPAASPLGLPAAGFVSQPSPAVAAQNAPGSPAGSSPAVFAAPTPAEPGLPFSSAAVDPLAESGDVVWYVRPGSGGQFGPAASGVMRSWLEQGRVGADSLVWREGWPDWRQAAKVFPQLGAGRPDPGLGAIAAAEAAAAGATAARSRRAKSLRQSNKTQTLLIILLIFAVVTLFGVFLWVLFG